MESLIDKKVDETEDLFEIQNNLEEKLPISLFQEIEADLCDKLMHTSSDDTDQTEGALDFIQDIVDNVHAEFETFLEDEEKKIFILNFSKVIHYFIKC